MTHADVLLGVDVGTTDTKVLVTTTDGAEILCVSSPSRWDEHGGRYTDMPAERLADAVLGLLERAARAATERLGPVRVAGIGVTGMGEAGVLLDGQDRPVFPLLAWFDPRGTDQVQRFPESVRAQFGGRTGLPLSPMTTVAKLAWMRDQGVGLAGKTWLNVAEYVIWRLGGAPACEMSLLARTGLLDQDSGTLWPDALDLLGAPEALVPTRVLAGTPVGRVGDTHGAVPVVLHGAALTVAGHDHPVAAIGCGVIGPDELFDSFGTAEALVRTVGRDLDFAARERLANNGIETVRHVLRERRALIAGTRAGLLLRRTLRMLGADHPEGRDRLDAAVLELPTAPTGLQIGGATNDDGILRLTASSDDVSPAAVFRAVLDHAIDETAHCLHRMATEVGPPRATVVAGGWTGMRSVRLAKATSLPTVRFSPRQQAGGFGAALFAAHAAEYADRLAAAGDATAVALDHPTGPSPEFATAFGGTPTRETPSRRLSRIQEIPV